MRAHLDIRSYEELEKIDPNTLQNDVSLISAIPRIVSRK